MTTPQPSQTRTSLIAVRPRRRVFRRLSHNSALWIGCAIVVIILLAGILSPWLSPYNANANDYTAVLQAPSIHHLFGTDELGRDELARVLIGARTSMVVAGGSLVVGVIIGVPIGLYFRLLQRHSR